MLLLVKVTIDVGAEKVVLLENEGCIELDSETKFRLVIELGEGTALIVTVLLRPEAVCEARETVAV
jgi:hypothetical protein